MPMDLYWRTRVKKARPMYVLVLIAVAVLASCDAILNTATPNNQDKREICKNARVDGLMTATCVCTGTLVQDVDLAGANVLHINTNVLKVDDCQSVKIASNVFARLQNLRQVELSNIRRIDIQENGFSWKLNESLKPDIYYPPSGIIVKIKNCVVPTIPSYAFKGILESVVITSSQIGMVGSYAFTNLQGTETIEFIDTSFRNVEAQAFKKFSVGSITLRGGHYGSLPSRTIVDVEVRESLLIENISADVLQSSALIIVGPERFTLRGCRFKRIEGEAFRVSTTGPTRIQNNTFESLAAGSFAGISVERLKFATDKHQELTFSKNNITKFEPHALVFNTSRLNPTLDGVIVDQPCDCNTIIDWTSQLTIYSPLVLSQLKNPEKVKKESSALSCRVNENANGGKPNNYQTFEAFMHKSCGIINSNLNKILIISGCSLLVSIIIIIVIFCLCKRRRARNQKWSNVPTSNVYAESRGRVKKGKPQAPDSRITMVVPDGRVYRETELHVIVEQAEPIGDDQHIYQNVKPLPAKAYKPVPLPRTSLK